MAELTGESFPALLVRPVPSARVPAADRVLAAGRVPVGSGYNAGSGEPGVTVWELCDPAGWDEPPFAVAVTRLRQRDAMAEVIDAAVASASCAAGLLRRLLTDIAAALRPAGCAMLIAGVAGADQAAVSLLTSSGFTPHPVTYDGAPTAALARLPVRGAAPGPFPAGHLDVMWLMMEL